MAQPFVRITTAHVRPAMRRISLYGRKLAAWPMFWEELGRLFAEAEARLFQSEGAIGGGKNTPWRPLSVDYAASKSVLFPGKTILVASGELEASLTDPAKAIRLAAPDVMVFGSDVTTPDGRWSLAELHYMGTSRMPARNPLISLTRQRELAQGLLAEWIRYDLIS